MLRDGVPFYRTLTRYESTFRLITRNAIDQTPAFVAAVIVDADTAACHGQARRAIRRVMSASTTGGPEERRSLVSRVAFARKFRMLGLTCSVHVRVHVRVHVHVRT